MICAQPSDAWVLTATHYYPRLGIATVLPIECEDRRANTAIKGKNKDDVPINDFRAELPPTFYAAGWGRCCSAARNFKRLWHSTGNWAAILQRRWISRRAGDRPKGIHGIPA